MKNIEQAEGENKIKKPDRFTIWDWIMLVGAMIMLPGGLMSIISDCLILISFGKIDDSSQLIAGLFWMAIFAWALKIKLRKFKKIKTTKAHKILIITTWMIALLILVPTILSFFIVHNNAIYHIASKKTATFLTLYGMIVSPAI
jgi:hypothetical protein